MGRAFEVVPIVERRYVQVRGACENQSHKGTTDSGSTRIMHQLQVYPVSVAVERFVNAWRTAKPANQCPRQTLGFQTPASKVLRRPIETTGLTGSHPRM
jgi:hypothetical protein